MLRPTPFALAFCVLLAASEACSNELSSNAVKPNAVGRQAASSMIDPNAHPHLYALRANGNVLDTLGDQGRMHRALMYAAPDYAYIKPNARGRWAVVGENASGQIETVAIKMPSFPIHSDERPVKPGATSNPGQTQIFFADESALAAQAWEEVVGRLRDGAHDATAQGLVASIRKAFTIEGVVEVPEKLGRNAASPALGLVLRLKAPVRVPPDRLLNFAALQKAWDSFVSDTAMPTDRDLVPQLYSGADMRAAMSPDFPAWKSELSRLSGDAQAQREVRLDYYKRELEGALRDVLMALSAQQ